MFLLNPIRHRFALGLALALWAAAAAAPGLAQDKVGVNTAVNPAASGTPPGGVVRKLVIGQEVLYNEHIVTGPSGQTEILFLDQSSLTVGPNADLNIDEFVYDPHSSTGRLVISVEHGVLRYVGGKLSKQENGVSIRTPSANVGVRGGEILLNVAATGEVSAVLVYGKAMKVTGKTGCTQELSRVGYGLTASAANGCPSAGHPVSSATLSQYLTQLDGLPGSHAGAATIPTNQTIAASDVPSTVSGNLAASVRAANLNQPLAAAAPLINIANLQDRFQQRIVQGQTAPAKATPRSQNPSVSTTSGAAVSSLGPYTGAYYGTLTYPAASQQGGSLLVTVANVIDANNILVRGVPLTSIPNFAAFLAGFSGGVTISPLTPGATNTPVTMTLAGSYSGPALPTSTPVTTYSIDLGTVASGTATVSPDGQFFTADLTVTQHFHSNKSRAPDPFGSTISLFSGVPTVTMPATGIGTYNGTATGTVFNNGVTSSATGNFSESYNFATLTGTATISNFDHASYTAPLTGSGNTFSGALSGASRNGSINGGFFGPAAGEVGGTFSLSGTTGPRYTAAGIFTGR